MTPDRQIEGSYAEWFRRYVRSFQAGDAADQRNFQLKEEHTWRVQTDAATIAGELGLEERDRLLSSLIALFHDLGRFPQYDRYRTFRDSESVNHAALGARVLIEQGVLRELPRSERNLVVRAVALHNVFVLPDRLDRRLVLHARVVRDADKLDIWRIFSDVFALPGEKRPSAAGLGLPETSGWSAAVLDRLRRRELVRLAEIRNLNDFKLLQLSWVYDLNFTTAFRLLKERGLTGSLAAALPDDTSLRAVLEDIDAYIEERSSPRGGTKTGFLP